MLGGAEQKSRAQKLKMPDCPASGGAEQSNQMNFDIFCKRPAKLWI
jgi:hypothetical protein